MSKGINTKTYKFKCIRTNGNQVEILFFLNSYDCAEALNVSHPTLYNHLMGRVTTRKLKDWNIQRGKWARYEEKERDITKI